MELLGVFVFLTQRNRWNFKLLVKKLHWSPGVRAMERCHREKWILETHCWLGGGGVDSLRFPAPTLHLRCLLASAPQWCNTGTCLRSTKFAASLHLSLQGGPHTFHALSHFTEGKI